MSAVATLEIGQLVDRLFAKAAAHRRAVIQFGKRHTAGAYKQLLVQYSDEADLLECAARALAAATPQREPNYNIAVPYPLLHELWAHCDLTLETGVAAASGAKQLLQPFHDAIQGKATSCDEGGES
jgi:hypothetical protein